MQRLPSVRARMQEEEVQHILKDFAPIFLLLVHFPVLNPRHLLTQIVVGLVHIAPAMVEVVPVPLVPSRVGAIAPFHGAKKMYIFR